MQLIPDSEPKLQFPSSVKIIKAKDRISPKEWNEFFNSACHKRNGNYKFTDQKNESDFFYYSKVFKIQTEPSFITDSRLLETKYGYCTIVKYKEYILINSKFCSLNKEVIKIIGTELPFEEFTKYFTKDTAEFEKITLSNSSIMSGIRSRIIEGQKLQENFRPIYSSKHVLKAFRVLQDGVVFSQSPSTSKLNYRNGKLKVEEYINWCKTIIDSINTNNSSKYFDNFAKPVDISKMKELVPTIIFIDLNFLKDYEDLRFITRQEQVEIESCFIFKYYNGLFNLQNLSNDKYIIDYNYPYVLSSRTNLKLNKNNSSSLQKIKYTTNNRIEDAFKTSKNKQLKINKNKKTITYHIEDIDVFYKYKDDDKEITLKELIENNSTILFDNSQFFYYKKTLFQDSKLQDSGFLRYFHAENNMINAKSEKGIFNQNSVNFSDDSIFDILEKRLRGLEYTDIICDDLGNERADYIAFDENRLGFFHAKYKQVDSDRGKKSASALHDVVSQALKNLVFLDNIENINLEQTYQHKWLEKYKNNNIQTQINRIRESANSSNSIVERIKETNRQINVQKYMVLVVNFISKSEISDYIQNPSTNTNTQIQQIVWLLSSFISTCQEMNIIPQIICKP
ncbi:hypothetical protein [uncultured Streptococcus sp.]|uniref:hypothetical protein n=1 Tax=uncultured Streptococcus sp. TaxID=83427 RepID=UPI0028EC3884|nr:hypothetical protein [uncultured Streptococcus sp.]